MTVSHTVDAKRAEAQAAAIRHRRAWGVEELANTEPVVASGYAGLVTRTVAFAIDGAVINGFAALVGIAAGLALSVLQISGQAKNVIELISGIAWIAWSVGYFTFFWSSTGETPGDRMMRIRVLDERGRGPLRPLRAAARFGFLILAVLPLGAGVLIMLWDERARCLQDRLARTVVMFVSPPERTPERGRDQAAGAGVDR